VVYTKGLGIPAPLVLYEGWYGNTGEGDYMKRKGVSSPDNNDVDQLWLLIGKVHHKRMLVKQRELKPYDIPIRHLRLLATIQELGSKATLLAIAKKVERKVSVISQQTMNMEKYGLVKRVHVQPRSRLLTIELTEKGLASTKINGKSKAMREIMEVLDGKEQHQLHSLLNKLLVKLNKYTIE
jgi:DNA-binding MarR family transcriptional regulator